MIDVLADSTQNLQGLTPERLFAWHGALFPSGRSGLCLSSLECFGARRPCRFSQAPSVASAFTTRRRRARGSMRKWAASCSGSMSLGNPAPRCARASLIFGSRPSILSSQDGNGRLGRAVFDLALAQGAGFHSERTSRLWAVSPVLLKRRREYYAQLEEAQKGNLDITAWLEWSTNCVAQACDEVRVCIERVVQIARFWSRHRETPLSPRQRRLLEMALVPDNPDDGWLTAKRAARQTKVERVTASRDLARLEQLGVIERDPNAGGREHALSRSPGGRASPDAREGHELVLTNRTARLTPQRLSQRSSRQIRP